MNTNMQHSVNEIEEDEIDLRELWHTIKEGKKIIFTIVIVVLAFTFIYILKTPNSYKSEAILIPVSQDGGGSSLGGLGGLAAMAGVNLGGSSMTPDIAYQSLLNNYSFMQKFIEKNKIVEYYTRKNSDENYVFAFGYRGLYDLFQSKKEMKDKDTYIYNLVKTLQSNFSISADKKSGLITVSYTDFDRVFAAKIINMFLKDASSYLVENGLKNIDDRLIYFEKEMAKAEELELRQNLSQMIGQILQEKVILKSKKYYQCDLLTAPYVSHVKAKVKPKRALILVVAFVTSVILGIFIVFFRNFLKESEEIVDNSVTKNKSVS